MAAPIKKTFDFTVGDVRRKVDGERVAFTAVASEGSEGVNLAVSLFQSLAKGPSGFNPGQKVKITVETVDG